MKSLNITLLLLIIKFQLLNSPYLVAQASEVKSPYKISWQLDAPLLVGSFIASSYSNRLIKDKTYLSREMAELKRSSDIHWFDRGATRRFSESLKSTSDQLGTLAFVAPLSLMLSKKMRKDVHKIGIMYLESYWLTSATQAISKHTIPRFRPFVYNDNLSYEQKIKNDPGKSFIANQTALIFSSFIFTAKVFNDYYPDSNIKPLVWGGAIGAATALGYVRYATGTHYPTDIIAGALVGSAIGYAIPAIHKITPKNMDITPAASTNSASLSVLYVF